MVCVDRVLVPSASPLQEPGHVVGNLRAAPWGWWFRSVAAWKATPENEKDRTGHGFVSRAQIVASLEEAGPTGSTWHCGKRNRIAAPVYYNERIVACLGLGGTPESLPSDNLARSRVLLEAAAQSLSALLSDIKGF